MTPAHTPPITCETMARPRHLRIPNASYMAVYVLKKPLQHILMPVQTATSFPPMNPLFKNSGNSDSAAPTEPNDVTGNAINSVLEAE